MIQHGLLRVRLMAQANGLKNAAVRAHRLHAFLFRLGRIHTDAPG